jgi:hypothetical protein
VSFVALCVLRFSKLSGYCTLRLTFSCVLLRWCSLQTLVTLLCVVLHLFTTAIALLPTSDPHAGAGVHEAERHQAEAPARVRL